VGRQLRRGLRRRQRHSADPYLISTPEQLALFRDQVNSGSRSICGQLTGDVNMGGLSWTPIGIDSRGLTGTFDGSGYAIRNLLLDQVSSGTSNGTYTLYGAGLFGIVGSGGTVRHVNVDSTITFAGTLTSNPDIAARMGSAFQQDAAWVNQGYPILAVMAYNEAYEESSWVDDELSDPADRELFERLTPAELKNRDLSQPITRAEFCAVALRLYEEESGVVLDPAALTMPFTDVSSDAIRKACAIGISNGVSATAFDPCALISREQMVTMLTRAHKAIAFADEGWTLERDSEFPLRIDGVARYADDADISGYARDSVYYMTAIGAIRGFEGNVFRPRNTTDAQTAIHYANATREQAIIISLRMFKAFNA